MKDFIQRNVVACALSSIPSLLGQYWQQLSNSTALLQWLHDIEQQQAQRVTGCNMRRIFPENDPYSIVYTGVCDSEEMWCGSFECTARDGVKYAGVDAQAAEQQR